MKKYMLLFFTAMIVLLVSCTNDIKYKITFHPNNDDESYTIEVNDGSLLEKPTDPLKEGYDFEKWYQDESFTQEWNFETMHVEGDLNLYAKYTKKALKFNVHFETNDGSDLQSIQVDENGLINLPESPTKEGYLFAGWYKNESLTQAWNFNKDKVTKEMTLYAKWKPLKDFNEGIKILSIGNSFSEDAHRYLYQILESSGIPSEKIVVANMYIGGAELKQHLENANAGNKNYIYQLFKSPSRVDTLSVSIEEALLKESWDIITFQQASHHSGLESTYDPHLFRLMRYVEAMNPNPNTILGFHMTWAYQQTSTHSGFANYDKSQQKMYQMITDTVKNEVLPISQLQFVIPSGTAIQNARTSYIGDKLTADGYHLTDPLGRYIAALMFYRTLIGEELSLEKVEFRPNGVDKTQQLMAYEAVNNAFNKPFEVTNSTYLEAPEPEPIEVNGLPFSYTLVPGYWNTNATEITNGGSAFDLQFSASNVIPKALLPVGSEIVVEPGYKYRVIFFEKIGDQFKVVHRTDNITTSYTLIDEAFWGNYQYIGFNVSNTEGTVINDILDTVLTKFRLYHPEGTELGHVDEDLEF